jgi:ABC-type amino acid transport substrate-binding protein
VSAEETGQGPTRRRRWAWIGGALLLLLLAISLLPDGPAARLLRQDATWHAMEQHGVWRVAVDPSFPPFETLDGAGNIVGFDVDMARAMAATWDMEVEFVAIGFDSLIDALIAGKVDSIVSALPLDPRLTKDIAYSEPYFEAGLRLAVPQTSPMVAAADGADPFDAAALLDGHTVAVEWGSTGDMIGRQLTRDGAALTLAQYPTPQEAVDALVQGAAEALLVDNVTLREAQGQGAAIVALGPALEGSPYVIAMPLRAHELHENVGTALETLRTSGAFDRLESTWFGPWE